MRAGIKGRPCWWVTFAQRAKGGEEVSPGAICMERIAGRGDSKGKALEMAVCLDDVKSSQEAWWSDRGQMRAWQERWRRKEEGRIIKA